MIAQTPLSIEELSRNTLASVLPHPPDWPRPSPVLQKQKTRINIQKTNRHVRSFLKRVFVGREKNVPAPMKLRG